jgi:hypothetical protein
MKSRIRGGDAARAAVAMAERRPVPLQATDVIGPHLPVTAFERHGKRPPRVRKPSSGHDVIYAPTSDTEAHRAELRAAFGETLSDQFVEVMVGKLISGLQIGPGDWAAPVQDARRGSAPQGARNGNYKHGRYTKEVAATRQWLREATHMLRDLNKRPG